MKCSAWKLFPLTDRGTIWVSCEIIDDQNNHTEHEAIYEPDDSSNITFRWRTA